MGTDGEGIRTLIVVSGCPLRCKYCINPFTWNGSAPSKFLTAQDILKRTEVDTLYMLATKGGFTFGGGEPLLYPDLIKEFRSICDSDLTIYVETSLNVSFSNILLMAYEQDLPNRLIQNQLLLSVIKNFNPNAKIELKVLKQGHCHGSCELDDDGEYEVVKVIDEWRKELSC